MPGATQLKFTGSYATEKWPEAAEPKDTPVATQLKRTLSRAAKRCPKLCTQKIPAVAQSKFARSYAAKN